MVDSYWYWLAAPLGLAAYLLGSLPTAYLVVRFLKGQDIRRLGSGNVGALNTYHQVGIAGSLIVLTVDTMKGALAVLLPWWLGAPSWTVFLTTTAVVVGHNWPVLLRFRGGKGVATILGISLVLLPQLTLIAFIPTILTTLLARNVVLGVGVGFIFFNILALATAQDAAQIALCLFLTVLATATYIAATWQQIVIGVKRRSLRGVLYGPNWNP